MTKKGTLYFTDDYVTNCECGNTVVSDFYCATERIPDENNEIPGLDIAFCKCGNAYYWRQEDVDTIQAEL